MEEFAGQTFDYVIIVCGNAREVCPVFPSPGQRLRHSFPDPAGRKPDKLWRGVCLPKKRNSA